MCRISVQIWMQTGPGTQHLGWAGKARATRRCALVEGIRCLTGSPASKGNHARRSHGRLQNAVPANKISIRALDIQLVTVQDRIDQNVVREFVAETEDRSSNSRKLGEPMECWSLTSSWRGAKSSSSTKIRY